jgi:putative phosphoribosyl transferase
MPNIQEHVEIALRIPVAGVQLGGELHLPADALGVALFAHGSGSSRHSPRNQFVATAMRGHGLGTLLFDLLTEAEEEQERFNGRLRFDIGLLACRLLGVTYWFHALYPAMDLGYFGSSTGAAAALVAEADSKVPICAVVSRGGRPDLAGSALTRITAPTLLIVGDRDTEVLELNRQAAAQLRCPQELRLIPGATHLFQEPGALEQVAQLAAAWFTRHFNSRQQTS